MGEEREAVLKEKIIAWWLQSSHTLKGPALERHAEEIILQEMESSLMKIGRAKEMTWIHLTTWHAEWISLW